MTAQNKHLAKVAAFIVGVAVFFAVGGGSFADYMAHRHVPSYAATFAKYHG